jgi:osmotically-inducible protein OsmY
MAVALALSAFAMGCEGGQGDAAVADRVMDRLRSEPTLASSELQARSEDGNVLLSGSVPTAAERKRAEDVADSVPGVDGVINQIEVAGATPPRAVAAPPPAERQY